MWRFRPETACRPRPIPKRPTRSVFASVNAPFTWPNNSLSKTPSDSPPHVERPPAVWWARVRRVAGRGRRTPLPVPFSPVMSTLASEGRRVGSLRESAASRAIPAISVGALGRAAIHSRLRAAGPSATPGRVRPVRTIATRRELSHGFWMKSRARAASLPPRVRRCPTRFIDTTGSALSSP